MLKSINQESVYFNIRLFIINVSRQYGMMLNTTKWCIIVINTEMTNFTINNDKLIIDHTGLSL